MRTVFSWSYQGLSDGAARMFRLLGLHPGPHISEPAAASLAGVTRSQARQALAELARAHLAAAPVHGRFTMHDLLRAYAADLALARDGDPGCHAAVHSMADHYLHTAHAAAMLLYPARGKLPLGCPSAGAEPERFTGPKQAGAWLEAEYPLLMAVTALAVDAGLAAHAWQIPWTLTEFQDRHGHWHDWVAAQRTALAAAHQLGDPCAQGYAHRDLGHAHARLGDFAAAREHSEHALAIYQQLGDLAGLARVRYALARLAELQSDPQRALGQACEALTLYQQAVHIHPPT